MSLDSSPSISSIPGLTDLSSRTAGLILLTQVLSFLETPFPVVLDVMAGTCVKLQPLLDSLFIAPILRKIAEQAEAGPGPSRNGTSKIAKDWKEKVGGELAPVTSVTTYPSRTEGEKLGHAD